MSNFMKIPPVEADCSMWTDGKTDKTKLTLASRNIANETNQLLVWVRSGKRMIGDLPQNAHFSCAWRSILTLLTIFIGTFTTE